MSNIENLKDKEAIEKLAKLADEIDICMFCTNLGRENGATSRPMSTQKVDDQGNIFFFSDIRNDIYKEVDLSNKVQLMYSHPGKDSFLILNGEADTYRDKLLIKELWSPEVKAWFPEGEDDPNISVIKVKPLSAYYWKMNGTKLGKSLKMLASAATGKNLAEAEEGALSF
ncbi:pyridoxamine 5'-phosphate oxidase family protein [Pararhodonellum marinum]|uniref:pyridoxamine 5'-phosphate oxidase family protein n=1 Tax=Pararhodonellum marinum TaxID=2755358 RepID=UPI00188EE9C8|nr:pyridoxamine 5'-phosphate oxidase family protein [Pararhodonellum marinum]